MGFFERLTMVKLDLVILFTYKEYYSVYSNIVINERGCPSKQSQCIYPSINTYYLNLIR